MTLPRWDNASIAGWCEGRVLIGSPGGDGFFIGHLRRAFRLKASNSVPLPCCLTAGHAATRVAAPVPFDCARRRSASAALRDGRLSKRRR
jgi:hypothetical protein